MMNDNNNKIHETKVSVECSVNSRTLIRKGKNSEVLYLLLHGFQQPMEWFFDWAVPNLPEECTCLAVQAPWPAPLPRTKQRILWGYAWYFYDPKTLEFYTHIDMAVDYVLDVIARSNLEYKKIVIVGYSQGGYMAPFIGKALPQTSQVIGIHSRFRDEDLHGSELNFQLDAIHGAEDGVVDMENSRRSHSKLVEQGACGQFQVIPGVGHMMADEVAEKLQALVVKT